MAIQILYNLIHFIYCLKKSTLQWASHHTFHICISIFVSEFIHGSNITLDGSCMLIVLEGSIDVNVFVRGYIDVNVFVRGSVDVNVFVGGSIDFNVFVGGFINVNAFVILIHQALFNTYNCHNDIAGSFCLLEMCLLKATNLFVCKWKKINFKRYVSTFVLVYRFWRICRTQIIALTWDYLKYSFFVEPKIQELPYLQF